MIRWWRYLLRLRFRKRKEASVPNKILVVDDDPPTCELITEVFSAAEVDAFSLTDSDAAASRLRKEKFDAVFLDVACRTRTASN